MKINLRRVAAIIIRHLLVWPRELDALAEAFWWPSFDLFIWGLMTIYLQQRQGVSFLFIGFFIGAIVLWMFVYRSQQEMGLMFLREAWDRNLLNLFTSPLTIWEFLVATLFLGTLKLFISATWMIFLAYLLFAFNIFTLGWLLVPFIINLLLVGWSAGLIVNGLIVQHGYRVQAFAWTLILIIQPVSAVFYPVAAMPLWMQKIAYFLPTSYIFEGMRSVLSHGRFDYQNLLIASGLNLVYLCLSISYFARSFRKAQQSGMIIKFS